MRILFQMVFVKNIEEDPIDGKQEDQFALLNGVLKTINNKGIRLVGWLIYLVTKVLKK